jgi:hypothetical protein
MSEIFAVTLQSLQMPDADFIVPAIDFWREVAEFELQIGGSQQVIVKATDSLMPILFACLVKIPAEELAIDDCGINLPMEAQIALNRIARVFPDCFRLIVESATLMVQAGDWQTRAGGYAAFLSAVEGGRPQDARVFFVNNLHRFIAAIQDESPVVRCAAISVVSACIEHFPEVVSDSSRMLAMFNQIQACATVDYATQERSLELLGQFVITAQQTGRVDFFDREYLALLTFLQQRLDEGLESTATIISETGLIFERFVRLTPDEFLPSLVELLAHVVERIQALGESLATVLDRTRLELHLARYCSVTLGIAARLGSGIGPFVADTMPVLIRSLDFVIPTVYEEAILAAGLVMKFSGEEGKPFIPDLIRHILLSQISQSPTITAFGAICVCSLMAGFGQLLDEFVSEIMTVLKPNLEDDFVPMKTKVEILSAMAAVIARSGNGSAFWEFFLAKIEGFAQMMLTETADREEGGALTAVVLSGYHTLLVAAREDAFLELIFRKFKVMGLMIEKREEFWNHEFAEALTKVLDEIIASPLRKTVNALIHKKTILGLIERAWTDFGVGTACSVRQKLKEM